MKWKVTTLRSTRAICSGIETAAGARSWPSRQGQRDASQRRGALAEMFGYARRFAPCQKGRAGLFNGAVPF